MVIGGLSTNRTVKTIDMKTSDFIGWLTFVLVFAGLILLAAMFMHGAYEEIHHKKGQVHKIEKCAPGARPSGCARANYANY